MPPPVEMAVVTVLYAKADEIAQKPSQLFQTCVRAGGL